jgi:CBS domain-containing protein
MEAMSETTVLPAVLAADVMTSDVIAVTEQETVAGAWELLARGRFHHLPVVRGGRCVGILDDRLLLRTMSPGAGTRGRRVADLLPAPLVEVSPATPLEEVAAAMVASHRDAAAVVDDDGYLVGVITCFDVISTVAQRAAPATRERFPAARPA